MHSLYVVIYFTRFALIAGGALALMWHNVQTLEYSAASVPVRHPEAPEPGEEVMYVDVSSMDTQEFIDKKQSLEKLYDN